MTNEKQLDAYYNKFNEDKRLKTKHAQVEFRTALKYLEEILENKTNPKILDVGAGKGAYSGYLFEKGLDVTAVELVKHNMRTLQVRYPDIPVYLGNATDLSFLKDETFDVILLFGPMYHLISAEDKLKALNQAKAHLKEDGKIMISYCMNEYAVLTHGFKEGFIKQSLDFLDDDFHIQSNPDDLYSYVRLEDINELMVKAELKRYKILSQDGPAEYYKREINQMDDESFELFLKYHLATCEREELLGAGRHILDILCL